MKLTKCAGIGVFNKVSPVYTYIDNARSSVSEGCVRVFVSRTIGSLHILLLGRLIFFKMDNDLLPSQQMRVAFFFVNGVFIDPRTCCHDQGAFVVFSSQKTWMAHAPKETSKRISLVESSWR